MKAEKKDIVFLFPTIDPYPIGGYKVAYEYADRFAREGYTVHLIYPYVLNYTAKKQHRGRIWWIKTQLSFTCKMMLGKLKNAEWFHFTTPVDRRIVCNISDKSIHGICKQALFIATAMETAYDISTVSGISKTNAFYLVQGFETWHGRTEKEVYNSYRLPLNKLAISHWLQKKVESTGEKAVLIQNGLDFSYFSLTTLPEDRSAYEIAFLYHKDDRKRCDDILAALSLVKTQIPELHVMAFGTPDRPQTLPDWYTYYQKPDKETHNMIYNTAAIFVAASEQEGWGLTPCEAMQCGAALVCTDIGGYQEFAFAHKTALLSPVGNIRALADNIITLMQDDSMRIRLAKAGNAYIQRFTWESAFSKLLTEIKHEL